MPALAESSLGLKLYDFFFEREVIEEVKPEASKIGVHTDTSSNQPVNKKTKDGGV